MYRIRTLIIFLFGIQSALVASAQGVSLDLFPAYQTENQVTVPTNPLDPAFAPAMYNHRQKMEEALKVDVEGIFSKYLAGNLPTKSTMDGILSSDSFVSENFKISSSEGIIRGTLRALKSAMPNSNLVNSIIQSRSSDEIIPIHFQIYDDETGSEPSAYYERGTHKIKMALDGVVKENWFTWFSHEYFHYFDPILRKSEMSVGEPTRTDQIAGWIRNGHSSLFLFEQTAVLNSYFFDLTNISITAEWRAWIATTLFVQKMRRAGLITQTPPCLANLSAFGFDQRDLSLLELKTIWWNQLKTGFYVDPTGLFTDSWLKGKLIDYVNAIRPEQLPLEALTELAQ